MPITLTDIYRYPVKSCRGERLTEATVEPWGLAGDRRFMLVDDDDAVVTAREHPRLVLARPRVESGALRAEAPDIAPLVVRVPDGSDLIVVTIWRSRLRAALVSPEADAWFSKVAGMSVRLVYLDDPTRRRPNPAYSRDCDRVSFADGYPLILATRESLDAVNGWIAEGPLAQEGPLPMRRFRPSVVVSGAPAWAEDGWRRLRIGAATFRVVKSCDRCVLTTIDPDTAAKGKEPIATLARYRRWDGKTWFAVNLIPDDLGPINVGDEVEVLDEVPADQPLC